MEQGKISLLFGLTDALGNKYKAESEFEILNGASYDELTEIGIQFNVFLKQAGYYRKENYIFMEDVTEDELCALDDFLRGYRENTKDRDSKDDQKNEVRE